MRLIFSTVIAIALVSLAFLLPTSEAQASNSIEILGDVVMITEDGVTETMPIEVYNAALPNTTPREVDETYGGPITWKLLSGTHYITSVRTAGDCWTDPKLDSGAQEIIWFCDPGDDSCNAYFFYNGGVIDHYSECGTDDMLLWDYFSGEVWLRSH